MKGGLQNPVIDKEVDFIVSTSAPADFDTIQEAQDALSTTVGGSIMVVGSLAEALVTIDRPFVSLDCDKPFGATIGRLLIDATARSVTDCVFGNFKANMVDFYAANEKAIQSLEFNEWRSL